MRHDVLLIVGLGVTLLGAGSAHADFTLQRTTGAAVLTPPRANGRQAEAPEPERTNAATPRFKIAQGFGRDVPLAFAVRQIVPPGVAVQYGAGVDKAAIVTWTGGRPWNRVLASAIRPLGLRMTTGATTVTISR